ncbi:MAG: amidohydrolase family protein [Planctomycetes bacterium]|nr:amidohydrolase family protein [Planctomycetota bacterium]
MRIDAHIHVWTDGKPPYPYNDQKTTSRPKGPFFIEDYVAFMDRHRFDQAVLIQTFYHGYDNSYLCHCLDRYPGRLRGVALLDPLKSDAPDQLERLHREHGVQGMRLYPITSPEASWLSREDQFPLWRRAESLGVPFTWFGRCHQIPHLETMLRRFPGVRVIVDHLGEPDTSEGVDGSFRNLLRLAACPNAFVKVTRLHGISGQPWPFENVHPFVRAVYEAFGRQRLVGWSGHPFNPEGDEMLGFRMFEEIFTTMTDEDRSWIFGKTAESIYGGS